MTRAARVSAMKRNHPEAYARVRAACVHAAQGLDLDDHAARIVEAITTARQKTPTTTSP